MNRTLLLNRNLINFGIPLVLSGVLILLMKSSFLNGIGALNFAITADLLLDSHFKKPVNEKLSTHIEVK